MSLQSIKSDPQLKILDISTSLQQHGGEILKQQQNLSTVAKRLRLLSERLSWQTAAMEKIATFKMANANPTQDQIDTIKRTESQYFGIQQVEDEIRTSLNEIDIPMRAMISVGNSLQKSSKAISVIATGTLGEAVKTHLAAVMAKPAKLDGLDLDSTSKASPHEAAEAEEKAEAANSLVDLGNMPS